MQMYDMKKQFSELYELYKQNRTPLEILYYYKLNANKLGIDCDVSKEVILLYKKYFSYLKNATIRNQKNKGTNKIYKDKYELILGEDVFRGDTLTSITTLLKQYVRLYYPELLLNGNIKKEFLINATNDMIWWHFFVTHVQKGKIILSENLKEFILVYHTLGNLSPVPAEYFNISRSNFGKWDSWDITLTFIYNWYNAKPEDDSALEKMFSYSKDSQKDQTLKNTKKWLNMFKTWEEFIIANHFQPFVYILEKDVIGIPKLFYANHTYDNPIAKIKDEVDELDVFLGNCVNIIKERNKLILNRGEITSKNL